MTTDDRELFDDWTVGISWGVGFGSEKKRKFSFFGVRYRIKAEDLN